jgi:sarcosine oxidase
MRHDYDVIVMGVGGMGSAALWALARRGARVCGIERFGVAHDRGSSHGGTRIIRKAYFEHPDYMPLLHRAYELWDELEQATGASLFDRCGFLTIGQPESETIGGLVACYGAHDVPHERIERAEIVRRYPQITPERGVVGFFDPLGGYLQVEECVRRQVAQARAAGAELRTETIATGWQAHDDGIVVHTAEGEITARRLVIATGAWAVPELARLGITTQVWRKVLFWYPCPGPEFLPDRLPTFYVETDYGHFYGFPSVNDRGVKVAEHLAVNPIDDPAAVDRTVRPGDEPPVRRFVAATFPAVTPRRVDHAVCMYTVTPDWKFVIDRHPEHPQVVITAGFSGHGFKFATVVGEIAAELALDGTTRHPVEFLGIDRFRS